jgi:hypothetical protein
MKFAIERKKEIRVNARGDNCHEDIKKIYDLSMQGRG